MNVLMLVKDSQIGGITSCIQTLTEGLVKNNVNVVIGTCDGEGVKSCYTGFQVEIIDFNTRNPITMVRNYVFIKKLVNKNNIQLIHAQNRIPALYASIYCFFNKKVKYIWSNHLVPIPHSFIHRITTKYGECAVAEGKS